MFMKKFNYVREFPESQYCAIINYKQYLIYATILFCNGLKTCYAKQSSLEDTVNNSLSSVQTLIFCAFVPTLQRHFESAV